MSSPPLAFFTYAVAAIVWVTIVQIIWHVVLRDRPQHPFLWTGTALTTLLAAGYVVAVPLALLPDPAITPLGIALGSFRAATLVIAAAVLRHLLAVAVPRARPSRRWLVANYGAALAATATVVFPGATPSPSACVVLLALYFLAMLGLAVRQMSVLVRPGSWRAGGLGEIRRPDLVVFGGFLLVLATMAVAVLGARSSLPARGLALIDATLGIAVAAPFAARVVSDLVPHLLTNATTLAAASALYLAGRRLGGGTSPVVDLVTIVALVIVLGPSRELLRASFYRIVFRRSRRRREVMQAFFHDLTPDLGVLECCRRAVEALAHIMQIPSVGMILADGRVAASGPLAIEPLARVWPRDAAGTLPRRPFGAPDFWDLPPPIQEALMDANVVGVVPVTSPQRRWGDLVAAAGHLSNVHTDEDIQSAAAFADRLALVLDAAELLARAVAVERSLAHVEKLAAIGETAARIAHDIRNPVTAARSLAQQLARDPTSPFAEEHALILEELERVERQVTALLRFARRDDFRFEAVDLGELVRSTVEQLRPRLDGAGVAAALDLRPGVVARADAEKLRQVIVNLVENAIDALAGAPAGRRLALAVRNGRAAATLAVSDNGPGVPPEALAHLFEPFFSLKPHGTGLGLAIAKRTIDVHGGRIAAERTETGMTFAIELPLASERRRSEG
jgi:signal transduction histidine kinase